MSPAVITRLLVIAAQALDRSPSTVGRWAAGDGRTYDRLRRGRDITTRRASRVVQWLSDHWPAGAEWPPDIPRPAPAASADPPAEPPAPAPSASPRAAAAAARERKFAAVDAGDWEAARRHEEAMLTAALTLGGDGRLADPGALCLALGVPRYIYDDAVRRYAGHPERRPRPTTRTGRMVLTLRLSGDRRFAAAAAPRPREAA